MELVLATFWLVLWFAFAMVVGVVAASRGRHGFGWFLLSIPIPPVVTLILVLLLPKLNEQHVLRTPAGEEISEKTHVRCPDCKELIRADASRCRYCGAALVPQKVGG